MKKSDKDHAYFCTYIVLILATRTVGTVVLCVKSIFGVSIRDPTQPTDSLLSKKRSRKPKRVAEVAMFAHIFVKASAS